MTAARDDATATRAHASIVESICARISAGESVNAIFRTPEPDYPDRATFWRWRQGNKEFQAAFVDALRDRALLNIEEIEELGAQEPPTIATAFGSRVDTGWVQWRKNHIDDRKWAAARMHSGLFGDKVTLAGDADNPIAFVDQSAIASKLLPELAAGDPQKPPGEPDSD